MISATDPENNVTTYAYDEEGNQIQATDPWAGSPAKPTTALAGSFSSTEPDEDGATRTTTHAAMTLPIT